jgi:triacylglycerol lipase
VLDGIAVTLVAGTHFAAGDSPATLWPHDGIVSRRSARGDLVPDAVLPRRTVHDVDDVHSVFFADAFGLEWTRALTWDPAVLALVEDALAA